MARQMTARYFKADGAAGQKRKLPTDLFDGVVHEAAIYSTVKSQLANRRQGTASAKNRSAVRGGGRKPWRQKGTGRARAGSNRSPIWRGGAIVFPPSPRSYRQRVPKKVRRRARQSAFNALAREDRVILLEDLSMERPKTRELAKLLAKLGVTGENVLLLTAGTRPEVFLSVRNIPKVEVRAFGAESAYDVMWADFVIIEESAIGSAAPAKRATASGSGGEADHA